MVHNVGSLDLIVGIATMDVHRSMVKAENFLRGEVGCTNHVHAIVFGSKVVLVATYRSDLATI